VFVAPECVCVREREKKEQGRDRWGGRERETGRERMLKHCLVIFPAPDCMCVYEREREREGESVYLREKKKECVCVL